MVSVFLSIYLMITQQVATNVKFVEQYIKKTLLEDLKRFEGVLLSDLRQEVQDCDDLPQEEDRLQDSYL